MKKFTAYFLAFLTTTGGLLTLLSFFGEYNWRFDLLSHFRVQFLISFFFLTMVSLLLKSKKVAIAALVFLIINSIPLLPFYLPYKNPIRDSGIIIFSANVSRDNKEFSKLTTLIKKTNPDIIVLEEVDGKWMSALQPLKKTYPYQVSEARDDYFGLTLMSKYPLQNPQIQKLGRAGIPMVISEVKIHDKLITVIGIHPLPPFSRYHTAVRNSYIDRVTELVKTKKTPVVLVGDMNTTPYSYPYRKFVRETSLQDCAAGFGYQPTWYQKPHLPPLGLRIDNCFHSRTLHILDSYVAEDFGSDHRPIVNRISIH